MTYLITACLALIFLALLLLSGVAQAADAFRTAAADPRFTTQTPLIGAGNLTGNARRTEQPFTIRAR